jgi:PAS domain S-box-containing protein
MLDVDTGLYVDANPMAEALHGLPRDALIGKIGPADLSPEIQLDGRPSSEAAPDYLSRALAGEFPRFEWMHLAPDGQETLCEVSLARLPDPHRNLVRASISDITERKAAEAQRAELEATLAQAQKLDAIGQLTAGVAHDFNNMLAVILGNAELLEGELGADNPQLATVVRAAKCGAELTQRLLAFSRKQVLSPEIINANKLISDITGLLRRTLEEHIDIETVTAAGLWNCETDPAQLENALVNLAINARDAMPDGGKLTIETANARFDDDYAAAQAEVTPGQYVMLAVTDTGSGIPPNQIEHVFEPFYTTKEVGKGSGLGLSMIYGFVKQSGGHVTVYSEEGEGTTIKLYLPRSTATEAVERKPVTDEVPVAPGETVLVVEDDPDLRTLSVALLSNLGYQVMEAATGPAALEQLGSTTRVNLLLTDVVLPGGMNGRELAAEVEQCAPGIPVLYMSGYAEDAITHHGRLDPDAELLQKPFSRADLARAVRKILDGSST